MTRQYIKHGGSNNDPLYIRYKIILNRLRRPNYKGVTMCDEWLNSFNSFKEWSLLNGYEPGLTIDRIDNEKGYSPENCRWVDRKTQANNRSSNKWYTYKGETLTAAQWGERYGIRKSVLYGRLRRGWSIERALETPVGSKCS